MNFKRFLKVGGLTPLFLIYLYFYRLRHTFCSTAAAQKRGAEPGIESGRAAQQADALQFAHPFELCCILFDLRRTQESLGCGVAQWLVRLPAVPGLNIAGKGEKKYYEKRRRFYAVSSSLAIASAAF
jgi:hypothetical protein